jgi:uncharacterized protein YjbI with pentapeptide repeats
MKMPTLIALLLFVLSSIGTFANPNQLALIKQINGVWLYECLNYSNKNLRLGDFSSRILRANKFTNCDFRFAKFDGAKITMTQIIDSNFREADFSNFFQIGESVITGCDFTDANLYKFNSFVDDIGGHVLSNNNFTRANFERARITTANLNGSLFFEANLKDSNFKGSSFLGVDFTNANLSGADFSFTDLTGANLSGAILTDTNFTNAILDDVILDNPTFTAEEIEIQELKKELAEANQTIESKEAEIEELLTNTLNQIQDGRAGSVVITPRTGTNKGYLELNIEHSNDFKTWTTYRKIQQSIIFSDGKKFYRFALDK